MRFHKTITAFLFAICFYTSHAQEIWDWDKCLQYALDNNIQIQLDALNIELSELQLKQDQLNLTPIVGADAAYTYAIGRTVDMATYQYVTQPVNTGNIQLSVSQPIFEGLKNINFIKKSKLDLKAAKLDNEVLRQNIQLQVMNAYLNILNAKEQLEQAKEQLEISTSQFENNKTLVRNGALAERILVDNEAQIAGDEYQIVEINQQLELAYMALKTILQMDLNKEIEILSPTIADSFELYSLESADDIYNYAILHRPEIQSADIKSESAEKELKIARSAYLPSLSFFTGVGTNFSDQITTTNSTVFEETPIGYLKSSGETVYTTFPNPILTPMKFGKQFTNNISYAVGLNLSIPIYNRRSAYLQTQRAKISIHQSQLNRKNTSYKLYNDIKESYLKAITSEKNYLAAQKLLSSTKKSFEFAQERFNNGAISQLELNITQNNLFVAQSRLSQAKYEYIFNVKILDFYSGKPIDFK